MDPSGAVISSYSCDCKSGVHEEMGGTSIPAFLSELMGDCLSAPHTLASEGGDTCVVR